MPGVVSSARPPQAGPRIPDPVVLKARTAKNGDFSTSSIGPYYPPESYAVFLSRIENIKNGPRVQIDSNRNDKTFLCRPRVAGQTTEGPSFQLNYPTQSPHFSGNFTSGGIVMSSLGDKLSLESLSFSATSGPWGWHANLVPNAVQATGNLDQDTSFTASIPAGATFSWGDSSGDVYNLSGSLSVSYTGSVVTVQINASGSIASHNLHQFGEPEGMSISGSVSFAASKSHQNCGIGVGLYLQEQLALQNPDNDKLRLYYRVGTQDFGHSLPFTYSFVEGNSDDNTGTCPPLPPRSGTGELSYSDEFFGRYADGTYSATAKFEDYPQHEARTTIHMYHPLELELFPGELHTSPDNPDNLPYDHVELAVSGPLCPDWHLRIPVKTASGDCIWEDHGSGFKEGINWDLTCNGQKVLPGLYHAELSMPYSYSPIKRPIKILGCVSGPQPSQEPTYDPSGFPIPPAYTPPPCEQGENSCELNAHYILPEDLNDLLQKIFQILPVQPQDLNHYEQLLTKLQNLSAQLANEGVQVEPPNHVQIAPPNPPQTGFQIQNVNVANSSLSKKAQRLMVQYETAKAEYTQSQTQLKETLQNLNVPLEGALQQIVDQFDVDYIEPELSSSPTLENYKEAADILIGNTHAWLQEKNTYSQATALVNYINLTLLYHRLQRHYLAEDPLEMGSATQGHEYQVEQISSIQEPRPLINLIARQLTQLQEKIQNKHQALTTETETLIAEAEFISQQLDAFELELSEFERELAETEGGFSIQGSGWFTRIDGGGWKGGITSQGSLSMPANRPVGLSIRRPAPIRAQNLRVKTQNNVSKASQQAQRAEQALQSAKIQQQTAQKNLQQAKKNWETFLRKAQYNPAELQKLRQELNVAEQKVAAANNAYDKSKNQKSTTNNNSKIAQANENSVNGNCGDNCYKGDKFNQVFDSIYKSGKVPDGWARYQNGKTNHSVKNPDVKRMLKNTIPGEWKKVYDQGHVNGNPVEIHYFQHSSGKVVDVKIKR